MATNNATKMATAAPMCMCSLLRIVYTSQGDHGSGRDFKVAHHQNFKLTHYRGHGGFAFGRLFVYSSEEKS
jgi:hypothetical protein